MNNASRIYKELTHEQVSVWFISDEYGFKIMVKAPSNAIKALINGCRIQFIFGKDGFPSTPIFHIALRIFDDPIHHLTILGVNRFPEEHLAVKKIMNSENIPLQFYNELNICVATASINFSQKNKQNVLKLLGNPLSLYSGEFSELLNKSLDSFMSSIDDTVDFNDVHTIETITVEEVIVDWQIIQNTIIGVNNRETIIIDQLNEGEVFEQQVWAPIQSLFDYDIVRKPQIKSKSKQRELTDILAYSEYGIFLFESKALAVLKTNKELKMERKVANLKKDIIKGIKQLTGAAKKIKQGEIIYDLNSNIINFNKTICPHCIILVSELLPFGDWKEIELLMFQAMIKQPMFLNVIDLKEFMRFIGYSKGSKYRLDYFLMERVNQFIETGTILMQSNFVEE